MKKFFEYLGLFSLVCFSFFLTDKTVTVVQEVDDLMVEIKNHQEEYRQEGVEAITFEQYVIPGLSSKSVNIQESYQEMKKIGVYDPNYFVYDSQKPKNNLDNHLEKYIVSGNPKKRMVSLLFLMNETPLSAVLEKVGTKNVSFGLSNAQFEKEVSKIEEAISFGNEFILMESDEPTYIAMKKKFETLKNPATICYNEKENKQFLSMCAKNKYYSITTSNIIKKSPLKTTKELLEPGVFLIFEVNSTLLEELPSILSYIESRGYTIEPLSIHIKED